jgi:hypothetical protein
MKTTIIALMLSVIVTEEGCEKIRLLERIYDMYANWYTYDTFTQIMLIIWTLGLGVLLFLIGQYLTTSNNKPQ